MKNTEVREFLMHNALHTILKVTTVLTALLSFTLAGNKANTTRTVAVKATLPTDALQGLSLKSNASTVNVGETIQLSVVGTYSDGSSKTVDENITYTVTPAENAEINNNILTAKKDGNVTVQATVGGVKSNSITLSISGRTNNYVLPPEPDPTVNNATLLGVDVNDNGVRDDVERWIYREYKDKHPIYIDIAMQAARGYKLVLETPEKAKEITLKVNGALFCGWYYQNDAYMYNDPTLVNERIDTPVKSKYFNTKERSDVYWQYDKLLSGGVYDLPRAKQRKALCDFNTSKY